MQKLEKLAARELAADLTGAEPRKLARPARSKALQVSKQAPPSKQGPERRHGQQTSKSAARPAGSVKAPAAAQQHGRGASEDEAGMTVQQRRGHAAGPAIRSGQRQGEQ